MIVFVHQLQFANLLFQYIVKLDVELNISWIVKILVCYSIPKSLTDTKLFTNNFTYFIYSFFGKLYFKLYTLGGVTN